MNKFPTNSAVLLSIINSKLRDFYPNLDSLCDDLNEPVEEIKEILSFSGYQYDEKINQFIKK